MRFSFTLAALLLLAGGNAFRAHGANLVLNPGFETGDLTGWTLSGAHSTPDDRGLYYGVDTLDPHSGSYAAYFGPVGGVLTVSQEIGTTPGSSYTLSFWVAQDQDPAGYINSFAVSFGGNTLVSQSAVPSAGYSQYTFSTIAASASSALQFSFRNDVGFFSLDDIDVSTGATPAIPEPGTALLLLPALAGLGLWKRYQRR